MAMENPFSPIGVKLHGRRVVFAGGGEVAERKLMRLVDCGAALTVIAPVVTPEIEQLAAEGAITLERRPARDEDFSGAFLAFIATGSKAANAELTAAARRAGALINRADEPADCDFVLPALAYMNTMEIGVFSGSPALAKWVRRHLEATLGPEFPEFAGAFSMIRQRVRTLDVPRAVRAEILSRLLNEGIYTVYRTSGMKAVMARVDAVMAEYAPRQSGTSPEESQPPGGK